MPPVQRLSAEERALWARVAATVTPLEGRSEPVQPDRHPGGGRDLGRVATSSTSRDPGLRAPGKVVLSRDPGRDDGVRKQTTPPSDTLDGGWDRRLRRGIVQPDRTIDLHGHTLATAHGALDHALARAVAEDVRVLLVVTGKPPKPDSRGRGLIRASIGDWLGTSGYRDRIAAVRNAHPRHGGAGALYVILRRKRGA
jgi:DNA-nicking Smr family endonuclease